MLKSLPLIAALLCMTSPLRAQVTVDLRALNALPAAPPAAQRPAPHLPGPSPAAPRSAPQAAASTAPQATPPSVAPQAPTGPQASPPTAQRAATPTAPGATATAAAPMSALPTPTAPPPEPANAPATTPQTAMLPPPKEAPPPATGPAPAAAPHPVPAELHIGFAAEAVALSADDTAALKQLAAAVPNSDSATFNVIGYAAAKGDDPSSARRISLSRALAVRNALIANGIASARIYVRALGSQTDVTPPDRVDVSVMGANGGSAGR